MLFALPAQPVGEVGSVPEIGGQPRDRGESLLGGQRLSEVPLGRDSVSPDGAAPRTTAGCATIPNVRR